MTKLNFDQTLDVVEALSDEEQGELVQIIRNRLKDRARQQLLEDVKAAEAEHAAGLSRHGTVEEIMRELES